MAYATPADLHERCPDFDLTDDAAVATVGALLEDASAWIDGELGQAGDPSPLFGSVATDVPATARDFLGAGTPYLRIDPHVGALTSVEVGLDLETPDYDERGGVLVAKTTDGRYAGAVWPAGIAVTVTAVWGSPAVPVDIRQATLDLAHAALVRSWATRDADKLPDGVPETVTRTIAARRAERALEAAW